MRFASFFVFLILTVVSCSRQTEPARSMEQIHSEDGVPVQTQRISPQTFSTQLLYYATVSGIEESSAYAALGARIEEIRVTVGEKVEQDQVILTFPGDSPEAGMIQAQAAYENARSSMERLSRLLESGGISQQEYDNASTGLQVAQANWEAAEQMIRVQAPISGVISRVNFSESDFVDKNMELITVSRLDTLKAWIWANDSELNQIQVGQNAIARWQNQEINGHVVQVNISINPQYQGFGVLVVFDNTDLKIQAGATVELAIITYENDQAIVLERNDIIHTEKGNFVYLNRDGKAEFIPVELGEETGNYQEILSGLDSGAEVIVAGQLLLEPGSRIKVVD